MKPRLYCETVATILPVFGVCTPPQLCKAPFAYHITVREAHNLRTYRQTGVSEQPRVYVRQNAEHTVYEAIDKLE